MRDFFILTFFLAQTFSLCAVESGQQLASYTTKENCQKLIDEANEDLHNKHYSFALEKLFKAELIAEENQWDDLLWHIKNRIGTIYYYTSNFEEALRYYQESLTITQKHKELNTKSHTPLSNIAVLYGREGNFQEALIYYKMAYDIVKDKSESSEKKRIASNMADAYIKTNQLDKGLELLKEVEDLNGKPHINFLWNTIYIEVLIANEELLKAKHYAESLYEDSGLGEFIDPQGRCFICITGLLSEIYEKLNQHDKAIDFAKISLLNTSELSDHVYLYETISKLYAFKEDYKTALVYKDSAFVAKDELAEKINRSQYEINKVKFKVQEYQNELIAKEKQRSTERVVFLLLILLGVLLFFLIYKGLKNKVTRQKQKTIIANLAFEKEKKEHQLTEQELEIKKHEVAKRNRELSAKTLYITNRNELIQDIISSIEKNKETYQNKEVIQQIRTVKSFLKTDEHLEGFIKHFEEVNPKFLKRLKEKHPILNANDIRFLCYVYMNLSLKEISIVFNISYDACRKRTKRIIKRMNLDEDASLYDYLITI